MTPYLFDKVLHFRFETANLQLGTDKYFQLDLAARDIHIHNNHFAAFGSTQINGTTRLANGGIFQMSNNLYYGASAQASSYDTAPVLADPRFINETDAAFLVVDRSYVQNFKLRTDSAAVGTGISITQPVFNAAGQGIFRNILPVATTDFFGKPLPTSGWNIGPSQ